MDSSELFTNVPTGIVDIISHVGKIFVAHWQPLFALAGVQILSFIGAFIVLSIFSVLIAGSYIATIYSALSKANYYLYKYYNGGNNRNLMDYSVDYSVGFSGASRLIERTRSLGYNYGNYYDYLPALDAKFIATLVVLYLAWFVVMSLVGSIYAGAFSHAIAEIYSGSTPTVRTSVKRGVNKMRQVFIFQVLYGLLITGFLLVTVVAPFVYDAISGVHHYLLIVLGTIGFILLTCILAAALTAAVPSIIVEGKSGVEALKRSLSLCKEYMGLILCTQLCFHVGLAIVMSVINAFLQYLPSFLSNIGELVMQIAISIVGPILAFVLYMCMRIRSEDLMQEQLRNELNPEMETDASPKVIV